MKTSNIFKTLLAIISFAMVTIACSNDDDNTSQAPTEGKGANINIKFDANTDLSQFANAYLLSYVNGKVTADTLDLSKEYNKKIASTNPTDTLGFVVYLCTKPGIADGTYQGKYNLTYTTTTTEDGNEVSNKTITDPIKDFKAIINNNDDVAEQDTLIKHMFTIKDNALVELTNVDNDYDSIDNRPETPTVDTDTPFNFGHLYYYNQMSTESNSATLSDNLAMRFVNRTQWTTEALSYGDLLFINGSDVTSIDHSLLKSMADNGTIFVIEGSKTQLETLCKATDIPCLITTNSNDYMYIISKGVVENNMPKADPIFIKLSPRDEGGALLDDYTQGVEVDMALKHVERYLLGNSAQRVSLATTTRADNPSQILNQLVSAYRVSILLPQTVNRNEYRKKDLKGLNNTQTNLYEVNYSIWNVFSLDEKRNFYYVHQELNAAFSPCYWNIYSKSVSGIAKVCEWYGKNVKTTLEPYQTDNMHLENSSPASTNGSTSYTSGVSFGLSGTVGYANKGPQISASASLSFSSSTTYSIPDIMVYNRCLSGKKFEWEYDLADVRSSFSLIRTACSNFYPGAAAGRSTLVSGADFMFSFPESSGRPIMKATLEVLLRSSCSKCGITCKVRNKTAQESTIFSLPYLTTKDFENK